MKTIIISLVSVLIVAGLVSAGGLLKRDNNGVAIQGHVPVYQNIRNDSKTGTKVFQSISTVNVESIRVICTDANLNTKACKARPNGGAYIAIPNGERTIILGDGVTSVRFENISGASSTTMFNTERM